MEKLAKIFNWPIRKGSLYYQEFQVLRDIVGTPVQEEQQQPRTPVQLTIDFKDINQKADESVESGETNVDTSSPVERNDEVQEQPATPTPESASESTTEDTAEQTQEDADINKRTKKASKRFRRFSSRTENTSDYTDEMNQIKEEAIANGTYMLAPNGKHTNLNERQWLQVRTEAFKKWFGDWINDPVNSSKVVDENGEPLVVYHGTSRKLQDNTFNTEFIFTSNTESIAAGYGFQRKGISPGVDYALSNFPFDDIISFRNHIDKLIEDITKEIQLGDTDPFYEEGDLERNKALLDSLLDARELVKEHDIFKEFEFNIFHVFSNIRNPLIVDAKGKYWHSIEFENDTVTTDKLANIAKERGYDGCIIKNVIDKGAEIAGSYSDISNDYIANNPNQIKSATDNNGEFSTTDNNIRRSSLTEVPSAQSLVDRVPLDEQAKLANKLNNGTINFTCR